MDKDAANDTYTEVFVCESEISVDGAAAVVITLWMCPVQ